MLRAIISLPSMTPEGPPSVREHLSQIGWYYKYMSGHERSSGEFCSPGYRSTCPGGGATVWQRDRGRQVTAGRVAAPARGDASDAAWPLASPGGSTLAASVILGNGYRTARCPCITLFQMLFYEPLFA